MVATRRKEWYTLLGGGGEWMRWDVVGDGISHCPCSREYEELAIAWKNMAAA